MLALVIGIICLLGLVTTVRHHRLGYAHGPRWHHPPAPGCPQAPPTWRRSHFRSRFGKREIVEAILDRVEATPEQEEVIRTQVRQFHKKLESMRGEVRLTREDLARALRADSFDENIMGDLFVRHDDELRELRIQAVEMLAHIHAVLDEGQRELLAGLVTSNHPFRHGGPYRAAW